MLINNYQVDNDLIEIYCHSIVMTYQSPTKSNDINKRNQHNRILNSIGVDRENDDFVNALDKIVSDIIKDKIRR